MISPADRKIELTLLGDPLKPEIQAAIEKRLTEAGLAGASLVIHQARSGVDVASIKQGIMSDLYREGLNTSKLKDEELERLRMEITRLVAARAQSKEIALELQAQYPGLHRVVVGEGVEASSDPQGSDRAVLFVSVQSEQRVSAADRERIEVWLRIRAHTPDVRLIVSEAPRAVARR